jgi:hypothetical protein
MENSAIEIRKNSINAKILLFHFSDNQKVHFIYSPQLDITGYGYSQEEAKQSFEVVFEDFVDYTIKKGTLGIVLKKLGWKQQKGSLKKPVKSFAPSITTVIANKKYVAEIFDKYPLNSYHQEVELPIAV